MPSNGSSGDYSERLRAHVTETQSRIPDRELSLQAIAAFGAIAERGAIYQGDLERIMSAAKSMHLGPFYIGTELLAHLFASYPQVGAAWMQLAKSRKAHDRWVAISALADERIPPAFAETIIRDGLKDRSAKVRYWATERAFTRKLNSLTAELRRLAQHDPDKKVAAHARWIVKKLAEMLP